MWVALGRFKGEALFTAAASDRQPWGRIDGRFKGDVGRTGSFKGECESHWVVLRGMWSGGGRVREGKEGENIGKSRLAQKGQFSFKSPVKSCSVLAVRVGEHFRWQNIAKYLAFGSRFHEF